MRGPLVLEVSACTDVMVDEMKGAGIDPTLCRAEAVIKQFPSPMEEDEAESRPPPLMSIPSFERFYSIWVEEEDALLHDLKRALENLQNEQEIARLVRKCYQHYREAVDAKIQAAQEDASYITAGAWKTPLEAGMMWMGGWRPTTAIVLAYSLMGIQVENELSQLLEGIKVPSMSALSAKQLTRLNAIQQRTSTTEDEISNRLAVLQMLVADQQMTRATTSEPPPSESNDLTEIKEAMEPKLSGLRDLFVEAENLRMRTLQDLFTLLSPVQAAQYTVAALEMAMAMRKLGDEVREAHSGDSKARPLGRPEKNLRDIVSYGDVEELQEALDTGLDPSEPDYDGRTALHVAAGKGHSDAVGLLVKKGAEVNIKDNFGVTPLLEALKGGHDSAAKILLNYGAKPQLQDAGNELCKAAANGDMEYVERLVKAGVDPNESDYSHRTPLHIVAAEGTAKDAEFLVQEGASILVRDRHGYTPLDEARVNDNEGTLKVLEAEVARQQLELHLTEDDDATSDDASSSSPMDELQEVGMQLTDGDHWSNC